MFWASRLGSKIIGRFNLIMVSREMYRIIVNSWIFLVQYRLKPRDFKLKCISLEYNVLQK